LFCSLRDCSFNFQGRRGYFSKTPDFFYINNHYQNFSLKTVMSNFCIFQDNFFLVCVDRHFSSKKNKKGKETSPLLPIVKRLLTVKSDIHTWHVLCRNLQKQVSDTCNHFVIETENLIFQLGRKTKIETQVHFM
jgi:hypothetical protein